MNCFRWKTVLLLAAAMAAQAQIQKPPKKPLQSQSASTVSYSQEDDSEVVEITNINFELAGSGIPGRSADEHLILRKRTRTREVVGDIGLEAESTIEAWPLGSDLDRKPLYAVTVSGIEPTTKNNELLVVSRGLEEVEWWSVYKLGTGSHLLDTYVPLLQFPVRQEQRYAGLEVPPDDTPDARLRAPNVVAVLTYASGERVIREALITCDDRNRAQLLRSYADANRTLTHGAGGLRIAISQNAATPRRLVTIDVPIAHDDLDLAHAQLPAGLHVTAWKR